MNAAHFMSRCLELAAKAEGRTRPNPMVGCVIAVGDSVVAEGFHLRAGTDHAEVVALKNIEGDLPADATLYVNLEPCSHFGRTPPCCDAVIASGVKRVVVGMTDPNPAVAGTGISKMRAAGIDVEVGVLEDKCQHLNRGFLSLVGRKRPWVVAKYAMTLDGKIASRASDSKWISGAESRGLAHDLRDRLDGVLVGPKTLILDNPKLTCRNEGGRDPVAIAVDPLLDVPISHALVRPDTVIFCSGRAPESKASTLRDIGLVVIRTPGEELEVEVDHMLTALGELELTTVLVEGGAQLLGRLFDQQLVDEVVAFIAPKLIGGKLAPSPIGGHGFASIGEAAHLVDRTVRHFGDDVCISGCVSYKS